MEWLRSFRERACMRRAPRGCLGALLACLLAACGGGGGGGGDSSANERVSVRFSSNQDSLNVIEGWRSALNVRAEVTYGGTQNLYAFVEERNNIVDTGDVEQINTLLSIRLETARTLTAGVHLSELVVKFCYDNPCTREVPGSPARLPLRIEVKPNISIQAPAALRRTGQEPAPSQVLALGFGPEMGTPRLDTSGALQAYGIELQGDRIVVSTRQLPAGQYNARVIVSGSADARYTAAVDLSYTVEPPPGGERPMAVAPFQFNLAPVQGTVSTHRFQLRRPTWTDALDPLRLTHTPAEIVKDVRHLGGDEYEFTVDTRNVPQRPGTSLDRYYSQIIFRAGEHGGSVSVEVAVDIAPPVLVEGGARAWTITPATALSELRQTFAVRTPDGAAVPWSAVASPHWLRVVRGAGVTGVDDLVIELDAEAAALEERFLTGMLTVTLDRPGTLPRELSVPVLNNVVRFDMASPGALIGNTTTARIHGRVVHSGELLPSRGLLQADGARIVSVRTEADPRTGVDALLAVDLADLQPGRPVTLRVASAVAPTQITLATAQAPRVPAGHATLPFGSYRAPSYAVGQQALVFAGGDAVWRWPLGGGTWGAPQSVALPGLVDATYAGDDSAVYALVGSAQLLALDPTTLAVLRQGGLSAANDISRIDTTAPAGAAVLRLGRDGYALVPTAGIAPYTGRGVASLRGFGPAPLRAMTPDIATGPYFADPGTALYWGDISAGSPGVALARSSHGGTIAVSPAEGPSRIYGGLVNQYLTGPTLSGRWITAISDAGDRMVRDDGLLIFTGQTATLDLRQVVPAGHVAAGYGVTGNGAFALVYGYRVAAEAQGPRARDARLYMVDLRGGAAVLAGPAAAAASIDLVDAVGCTTTLVAGETCAHAAQVVVAPGDASAFVLGPRGVAALTLAEPAAALRVRPTRRVLPAVRL